MSNILLIIFLILFFSFILALLFWAISGLLAIIYGAPTIGSEEEIIDCALRLAQLQKNEIFLDLGCGWGKVLNIAQKKFGAKAIGLEISPICWLWNKLYGRQVIYGDLTKIDFQKFPADVIYFYLSTQLIKKMTPLLKQELKKGRRIISLSFPLEKIKWQKKKMINKKTIYLYA